jgi:hypothetical protein
MAWKRGSVNHFYIIRYECYSALCNMQSVASTELVLWRRLLVRQCVIVSKYLLWWLRIAVPSNLSGNSCSIWYTPPCYIHSGDMEDRNCPAYHLHIIDKRI